MSTAAVVLAGESQKSGPIGLAVILVLCVAAYFLFKSMSRHMRKVREEFPADADEGPGGAPSGHEPPGDLPGGDEPAAPLARDEPEPPAGS